MPELPEVEVVRQGLAPHLCGRRILQISSSNHKLRLPVPRARLAEWIQNQRVHELDRRGKYLLIRMTNQAVLVVHLGMSGRLGLFPADAPRVRHDHLRCRLDNDLEMRFNDPRRFGSIQVLPPGEQGNCPSLATLGPEPFWDDFSASYLLNKAAKRSAPVKNFLMDGRVVAGIGNIYTSEILHAAGIGPRRPIGRLSRDDWQGIIAASRRILAAAIKSGGTTIADFVNSSGEAGYFQLELQAYGRENEPCRTCGTPIAKENMAGRATYHCPRCQPPA